MNLYGIANCDTVRKARDWLAQHQIIYTFHDFKKTGVTVAQLSAWAEQVGWEKLLNRQGTTWRRLPDTTKAGINSAAAAFTLMAAQPSCIKRPVLACRDQLLVGFNETEYAAILTTEFSARI